MNDRIASHLVILIAAANIGISSFVQTASAAEVANAAKEFNVREFGAAGDGKVLDTEAINKAVDAAAKNPLGGVVVLPPGRYRSFSIRLKSNIALRIDSGAVLVAAAPGADGNYDPPEPNIAAGRMQDFSHMHWHNSLIWAENQKNIAIGGGGMIDGTALIRSSKKDDPRGNKSIGLRECSNVSISGITIMQGGHFAMLLSGVQDLDIHHLTLDTNRDGIDIDCCQRVRISDCIINAPRDDGIAIKNSFSLGKLMPTQDIAISNCHLSGYDEGTLLDGSHQRKADYKQDQGPTGRIKLGTETTSGCRNISISHCDFVATRGLAIESVDGGATENISIDHVTMRDVTDSPIFVRLGIRLRRPLDLPSEITMKGISISNVVATNVNRRFPMIIAGVPNHPIENVTLRNVDVQYIGGGNAVPPATQPVLNYGAYPEPEMFPAAPAYGFYGQYLNGLTLSNIKIRYATVDHRPPIVLENVDGAACVQIDAQCEKPSLAFKAPTTKPSTP